MSREIEVLVLDDEPIVCERLRDYLEKRGMVVETFTDSKRALERLGEKSFDVVVTDIKMEGPTGVDVLVAAKRSEPSPEVILITGYGSFETMREAEAVGAFDYINKPFTMDNIYKRIKKAARKARRNAR